MKATLLLLPSLLLSQLSWAGNSLGGGGSAGEPRFKQIAANIRSWIVDGGSTELTLFDGVTHPEYKKKMLALLADHATVITFETKRVEFDNHAKTCVSFYPGTDTAALVKMGGHPLPQRLLEKSDGKPHIICNLELFNAMNDKDRFPLVHHEFASLAGVEKNHGASSDYRVSDQLSPYLEKTTVYKLAIKSKVSIPDWMMASSSQDMVRDTVINIYTKVRENPTLFPLDVFGQPFAELIGLNVGVPVEKRLQITVHETLPDTCSAAKVVEDTFDSGLQVCLDEPKKHIYLERASWQQITRRALQNQGAEKVRRATLAHFIFKILGVSDETHHTYSKKFLELSTRFIQKEAFEHSISGWLRDPFCLDMHNQLSCRLPPPARQQEMLRQAKAEIDKIVLFRQAVQRKLDWLDGTINDIRQTPAAEDTLWKQIVHDLEKKHIQINQVIQEKAWGQISQLDFFRRSYYVTLSKLFTEFQTVDDENLVTFVRELEKLAFVGMNAEKKPIYRAPNRWPHTHDLYAEYGTLKLDDIWFQEEAEDNHIRLRKYMAFDTSCAWKKPYPYFSWELDWSLLTDSYPVLNSEDYTEAYRFRQIFHLKRDAELLKVVFGRDLSENHARPLVFCEDRSHNTGASVAPRYNDETNTLVFIRGSQRTDRADNFLQTLLGLVGNESYQNYNYRTMSSVEGYRELFRQVLSERSRQ